MKFNVPINNFASGEWSPKMLARTETEQYYRAAEDLQNSIPQMQGGAFRRPGTAYVDLNTEQAYMDGVYKVIPFILASRFRYLLFVTSDAPSGTNKWFVRSVNGSSNTLVTASTDADFSDTVMQFVQIGDTVFISSNGKPLRYLQLSGSTWNLKVFWEYWTDFNNEHWKAYPYGPIQADNIDGTITATGVFTVGGAVTLTSSKNRFSSFHVPASGGGKGLFIKLTSGGSTGVVEVTGFTNATTAAGTVRALLPGASPTTYGSAAGTAFEIAAWNGNDGFPKAITAHQGRLYAGLKGTLYGTRIGNFWDFMEVPFAQSSGFTSYQEDNSRPFSLSPTAAEGSNIVGLSASKVLIINTHRNEIAAKGTQGALGPNDFDFESSTSYGAEEVQPARVNNFLTFLQRGGRKIRDMVFNFNEDQYKSTDLSFVADHMMDPGDYIVETCAAEIGSSVLICRSFRGKAFLVTLDRDYQINAWAPLVFGGTFSGLYGSYAECVAVAPITGAQGQNDSVFFVIKRTINGSTQVYLEELQPFFEYSAVDISSSIIPIYVDSAKIVTQASSVTVSGYTHLAGQTVSVIAEGIYVGEKTVSALGVITLDTAATYILAGLQYTSIVQPTPIEQGASTGSAVGRDKRVHELFIRLYNSRGVKYGIPGGTMFDVNTGSSLGNYAMFTGDVTMKFPPGYSKVFKVKIQSNAPYPCNVIGVGMQGVTYD